MKRKLYHRGRPPKDRRICLSIAATIDYRGDNDDELVFVFRGAYKQLVIDTFRFLVGRGDGIAAGAEVLIEHDCIRRNGKGFWRIAVSMIRPNFHFCSLKDMTLLIEATLHRLHPCTVTWFTINKFLNI
ncbi:hypothetical protein [Xylanibacter rodentium]|uniref:hypothetical protein n=1 Tax=Xylanibacter rodentium TaxID=2736289 RepID=UPI0025854BC4|nr:hypothetical protein [Xylanibacter rodentium]